MGGHCELDEYQEDYSRDDAGQLDEELVSLEIVVEIRLDAFAYHTDCRYRQPFDGVTYPECDQEHECGVYPDEQGVVMFKPYEVKHHIIKVHYPLGYCVGAFIASYLHFGKGF